MNTIFSDKVFYHIYPLGLCNCQKNNDFSCPAGNAFEKITLDLDRIKNLGVNALYIGPISESTAHGYDTIDYFYVDRRLGNNEKFKVFCEECHKRGIAVVLDAVFNHTGRDFFAFKDLQQNGWNSRYKDWYLNVDFNRRSNYGDCFDYEGWAGCKDLVKLNLRNPEVKKHLLSAVDFWINEFCIDGLRLDAADVLDFEFLDELSSFCKSKKSDFWLMGEVVHGDYNNWAKENRLDSVTNYQLYKALWSSLNDKNFFELYHNLEREFGDRGIYKDFLLYNFLDNHDVNRIASTINNPKHLFLVWTLLFLVPGIPSIYYGSEFGINGKRNSHGDFELRPTLPPFANIPDFAKPAVDSNALENVIKQFAVLRNQEIALQKGGYKGLFVSNEAFAFQRDFYKEKIIIAVNATEEGKVISLEDTFHGNFTNLLTGEKFSGSLKDVFVPGNWLTVIKNTSV